MSLNDFQRTNATSQLAHLQPHPYTGQNSGRPEPCPEPLAGRHARDGLAHGSGLDAALV